MEHPTLKRGAFADAAKHGEVVINATNGMAYLNALHLAGEANLKDKILSGKDAAAKTQVRSWLMDWFGWQDLIDLGDITSARGAEMYLPI